MAEKLLGGGLERPFRHAFLTAIIQIFAKRTKAPKYGGYGAIFLDKTPRINYNKYKSGSARVNLQYERQNIK